MLLSFAMFGNSINQVYAEKWKERAMKECKPILLWRENMVQAVQQEQFIPVEEYLAKERGGCEKHEWYNGECFAMAGGTRWHNILSSRIISALVEHLDGTPCTPYMADFRLSIEAHQHYVYPDIMVVCNESSYIADDMANNAEIVLEVLSKGTESYDRGQKFLHYQSVPLLREYILVSQDAMQVEIYRRREGGRWEYQRLTQPSDALFFEAINCSIVLEKLYRSIPL
jgi:Uma2 family endonuclease